MNARFRGCRWVRKLTLLTIDLQDGFSDDLVTVKVNGKEVLGKKRVSTEFQIGWAERLEVDVDENHAIVDVSILTQSLSREIEIDVPGPTFVGLSIDPSDGIGVRVSSEPFGYL